MGVSEPWEREASFLPEREGRELWGICGKKGGWGHSRGVGITEILPLMTNGEIILNTSLTVKRVVRRTRKKREESDVE